MSQINMNSITKKLNTFLNATQFQKKINEYKDKIMLGKIEFASAASVARSSSSISGTPSDAAEKFIEVLCDTISRHTSESEIAASVANLLSELDYSQTYSLKDGTYCVYIYFRNDLRRESLYSEGYPDGLDNIAALLNTGYSAKNTVYGFKDGKRITSRKKRSPLHFLEEAISEFMENYANNYGILKVEMDPIYTIGAIYYYSLLERI